MILLMRSAEYLQRLQRLPDEAADTRVCCAPKFQDRSGLARGECTEWQGVLTCADGAVGVVEETCEGMLASFCSSGQRQALLAFIICTAAPPVRQAGPGAEHI